MGALCDTLQLRGGGVVSLVGAGGKTTLMFQLAREFESAGDSVLTTTTTKIFKPAPDQAPMVIIAQDISMLQDIQPQGPGLLHFTAAGSELAAQNKLIGYSPQLIDSVKKTGPFRWIVVEADGAWQRPLKAPNANEPVIPASSSWVIAVVGLDAIGKPLDDGNVFRPQIYSRLTGVPVGAPITAESVVYAVSAPDGIMKGCPPRSKRIVFLNKAEGPDRRASGMEIARSLLAQGNGSIHRVIVGSLLPKLLVVEIFEED